MGFLDKLKALSFLKLDHERVMAAILEVKHPESGRSFQSLDCIKDLDIEGNLVRLKLELSTVSDHLKPLLKESISRALGRFPGIKKLEIDIVNPSKPSTPDTGVSRGGPTPVVFKSLEGVKHIIAVASGKGGVGKSSTAVNLAFALAAEGMRVGLLDADVYGPSVSLMTSASRPQAMDEELIVPPEVQGIKIISPDMFSEPGSAQMLRGPMVAQIVKQLLTQVKWGALDYLLIDYPPGTGDIQLTISQTVNLSSAVIVTTPQEVSLSDVRKAVQMFSTLKVPLLGVVETMSYFVCDSCDKQHRIFPGEGAKSLKQHFGLTDLAKIPLDPKLAESADKSMAVINYAPESAAAKAFIGLAQSVLKEQERMHAALNHGLSHFRLEWKAD